MICMKSILPKTKVLTFYRNVKRNDLRKFLPFLRRYDMSPIFSKEDAMGEIDGFRNGCSGDSGSGQVFNINAPENPLMPPRFVLAAIYDGETSNRFEFKNQDYYNMPCGSYMINKQTNLIRKVKGRGQSTTYEETFKWIKSRIRDLTITPSATN